MRGEISEEGRRRRSKREGWNGDGESKTKMSIMAHVEVTASPETGNEEVSRFQLYHTFVPPPPGYLHTISSLQRRGATRRGRELEERERVTRTTVSPGRCVTHSAMTRWCLKQRRWSPII